MAPQLQDWHDRFRAQGDEAAALAGPLSEDAFNAPGPGGGWSVGQCLGHLLEAGEPLIEDLYVALERARTRQRRGTPPFGFGWAGRLMIQAVTPGGRALPAPPAYRPAAHYDRDATVERFARLQAQFADFVVQADGYDLARMRAPSPALPFVRLKASAWLEGTLRHQQRHLAQARRAAAPRTGAAGT